MARLTSRRGKFNSSKHPRGAKGRFTSTPDEVKAPKIRKAKRLGGSAKSASRQLVSDIKTGKRIEREKLELLGRMDASTRNRVVSALKAIKTPASSTGDVITKTPVKGSKKPKLSEAEKRVADLNKTLDKNTKAAAKLQKMKLKDLKKDKDARKLARRVERANQKGVPAPFVPWSAKDNNTILGKDSRPKPSDRADLRKPVTRESLKVTEKKVYIWEGDPSGKYKGNFRERVDRNFKYEVKVGDDVLTLNTQTRVMVYDGEVVKGVPSLNARLREVDNKKIVDELALNAKYVEAWDRDKVAVPAPRWDVNHMGGKNLPEQYKPERGFGGMELHHINQWSNRNFRDVRDDLDSGKITLDDAKTEMRGMLRPNPNIKSGYEIAAAPKGERAYVVLPAGLHNFSEGKKVYEANHPDGIHPDTGQVSTFGLADKDKGSAFGESEGRQYHNRVRDGFWGEYRRREVFVLQGELNRRLRKGLITTQEVEQLWSEAVDRQEKSIPTSKRGTQFS